MEQSYIYGLYTLKENETYAPYKIQYVGKSNDPHSRLNQHLKTSKKSNKLLENWIKECKQKKLKIQLIILDSAPKYEIVEKEKEWINKLLQKNKKLLNVVNNKSKNYKSLTDQTSHLLSQVARVKSKFPFLLDVDEISMEQKMILQNIILNGVNYNKKYKAAKDLWKKKEQEKLQLLDIIDKLNQENKYLKQELENIKK